jgi:MFS family permease
MKGSSGRAQPRGGNRQAAILAVLSFAMLIVSLDQYIVVVALPDIARDLGYSVRTLQSVISAYAVASSGFLLFGGRAADLLGRRRILLTGLAFTPVRRSPAVSPQGRGCSWAHARSKVLAGRWSSPPPWRSSTPRSPRAANATVPWGCGEVPARPAW